MRMNYLLGLCWWVVTLSFLTFFGCNGSSSSRSPSRDTAGGGAPISWPKSETEFQANPVDLSGVWANDGGDKVTRQELRASRNPTGVVNSVWQDSTIRVFGARNEVISFNLVLEASVRTAQAVTVTFNRLADANGRVIQSTPTSGDGVFNWTARDIELFFVRYLKIQGLSRFGYEQYDERHIPERLRRPWSGQGVGRGTWSDRPAHDQEFPDIAVPLEIVRNFVVSAGTSQSIWVDIYIPKTQEPGLYQGALLVNEGSHASYSVPVQLSVRPFALPDIPHSKTMLYLGYPDIARRYVGQDWPSAVADRDAVRKVRDRHFQLAHRHRISLIDSNEGDSLGPSQPVAEWLPRLNGQLFTGAQGYRGPGEGRGNDIFSIGTFGNWSWKGQGEAAMWSNTDAWARWFSSNFPGTDRFLYLVDESSNYPEIQQWGTEIGRNPGPGRGLASLATLPLTQAVSKVPALTIATSTMDVGDTLTWDSAVALWRETPGRRFFMYNGKRPASGSFMIDDDGVALRQIPWGQYKKGIDRWFYWESTYYKDFQSGRGQIDVFNQAQTFGPPGTFHPVSGMTSGTYSNGDGVLFYPGTDRVFPGSSYGLSGPIASLRLKHWRRGVQDVDYLVLAATVDPARTQAIVKSIVPKVLWENGVSDPSDPSWVNCDIGWSSDPEQWEAARAQLVEVIEGRSMQRHGEP